MDTAVSYWLVLHGADTVLHWRSVVMVCGALSYWFALHVDVVAHTRLDVAVGGVTSYCDCGVHIVIVAQALFEVDVGDAVSYCADVHVSS